MTEAIYRESHLRSILKAISWRVIASLTTFTIADVVTGKIQVAATIAGTEAFAKIFIYYLHERGWQMVPHGAIRKLFRLKTSGETA